MSLLEALEYRREEKRDRLSSNPLYTKVYKQHYITGTSALNIPYKGIQCDWHQIDTLKAGREGGFVMHPSVIIGAEDVFGEYGIWDCSEWLRSRGFKGSHLCATPIRSILDILYYWIAVKVEYPQPLAHFWDFMFDEIDTHELYSKFDELESALNSKGVGILKRWREENGLY